jgi:hypothetical protein
MRVKDDVERLAFLFVSGDYTLRRLSAETGISKSMLHNVFRHDLPKVNSGLYSEVDALLKLNKADSAKRGAAATKAMWMAKKKAV